MVLSPDVYGEVDEERSEHALRHAIDVGARMVDTGDGYSGGHNERLIGAVVRDLTKQGRRDDIVIATKFGFAMPADAEPHAFPVSYEFGKVEVNTEPKYIRGYAEASLRRLGADLIDLYYPHFPDPQVPIEDVVGAVGELVDAGLVRHIGLSNVDAATLRAAHAVRPVAAVQTQWSMWAPVDPELHAATRELGVGVVAWGPLGTGFLTGTVRQVGHGDFRQHIPGFTGTNLAANHDRFAPVRDLAAAAGLTPGQLALAWLLHADPHVVPIPGSRTPAHIDENLDAARVTLSQDLLAELDEALTAFSPAGTTRLLS